MDIRRTYNKIAKDWFKDNFYEESFTDQIDRLTSFLKKGSTLLDIGCGPGLISRYISEKGIKVTGIDFSEMMIKIARVYAPSVNFLVMDAIDLRHFNKTFDAVNVSNFIGHFNKNEVINFFELFSAKVKKNGYLHVSFLVDDDKHSFFDYNFPYEIKQEFFKEDFIKKLFIDNNFEIVFKDKVLGRGHIYTCNIIGKNINED